ncbi:MAG: metallophosphoesterase [Clostridia bacterium]|nr:metallophosphoesterase [Clostridia bacterium]
MIQLKTKIEQIYIEPEKRILVTSDIHGCLSYFKNILKKASFSDDDILFIVGDIIEKGPENLAALRYVMELYKRGNVVALIGNVDAYRIKLIQNLNEENANEFFNYIVSLKEWIGTSFYQELAAECGYTLESPNDVLAAKSDVLSHFEEEFRFIAELPTVVETQNFVFVHGGLRKKNVWENADKSVLELTKYDAFAEKTPFIFDKYVIAGHWPVTLYSTSIQQFNPVINKDKRIISLDGGCGIKKDGQLNLLIIPDINSSVDSISHISYDELPLITALDDQEASKDSVSISWADRKIRTIKKGEEFSLVEHISSGRQIQIPNTHLKSESECYDYSDYMLAVQKGDFLSLLSEHSNGCIVKKNGVVGWYNGAYN